MGHAARLGKPRRRERLNWRFIYPIRCQGRHIEESWPLRVLTKCQKKKKKIQRIVKRKEKAPESMTFVHQASTCQRLLRPSFNGYYCYLSGWKETEMVCPLVSWNNTHTHPHRLILPSYTYKKTPQTCYIKKKQNSITLQSLFNCSHFLVQLQSHLCISFTSFVIILSLRLFIEHLQTVQRLLSPWLLLPANYKGKQWICEIISLTYGTPVLFV